MKSIEYKKHGNKTLALILRAGYKKDGIEFFTPDDFPQQLGYMKHKAGHKIIPHIHNKVTREVHYTFEVLFIKSGKVNVNFYDDDKSFISSEILYEGDVIMLAYGGHGFDIIEDSEMIEVKQGPYVGDDDKSRFNP